MAREIVSRVEGRYYAQRNTVRKHPTVTKYSDGTESATMGFVIAEVDDDLVFDDKKATVAEMIADALNFAMIPTIEHYSDQMSKTAIYRWRGTVAGLSYVAHKLAGEAGEFNEKFGKMLRDGPAWLDHSTLCRVLPSDHRDGMLKELGDVLWYVNQAAKELGSTLREVAEMNIAKLKDRKERGKLSGSGDER